MNSTPSRSIHPSPARPGVRRSLWAALLGALLCLGLPALRAQTVPPEMNYQGRLLNAAGAPLADGNYQIVLNIFNANTAGTLLWGPLTLNAVPLVGGQFNIRLGNDDTARPIAGAFMAASAFLQVQVGANPPLTPRQQILTAPYAFNSGKLDGANWLAVLDNADPTVGKVPGSKLGAGSVTAATIADGSITTAKLADGAVTTVKLADNAVTTTKILNANVTSAKLAAGAAQASLLAGGLSGVPNGGMVLSASASDAALISAGYVLVGPLNMNDSWDQSSAVGAPGGREYESTVWTGTEMILWGGVVVSGSVEQFTGGRHNPSQNSWTATSTGTDVPTPRYAHAAVWTGTEMIIWGGQLGGGPVTSTGARYNPVANTWISTAGNGTPPAARDVPSAVWTGTEMIVWGGSDGTRMNTGGRLNPTLVSGWTATSTVNAPSARYGHSAIWTGTQMIIWGGNVITTLATSTGGRYTPGTDSWLSTSITGVPSVRAGHTAVWTGTRMLVWGGLNGSGTAQNTGGRYDPVNNVWTPISTVNAPAARQGHTAVWTGTEMIVWGGRNGANWDSTGGRYNPVSDTWTPTYPCSAPVLFPGNTTDNTPRCFSAWTGRQMLVMGAAQDGSIATYCYTPRPVLYAYAR